MTVEVHRITSREGWLNRRRLDLTASDVPAVAGIDPRRSALSVYEAKRYGDEGIADTNILRRGRWLESAVLAALAEERPDWIVRRAGVYLRDPEIRLGATPDAVASVPGHRGVVAVQCKVVAKPVFERDWQDGVPDYYAIQTLTESLLLEAATAFVVALVIDAYSAELEIFEVPRHAAAEARIRELTVDFWRRVASGEPPAADYVKDQSLIAAIGAEPEKEIDLSGDNRIRGLLEEHEAFLDIGKRAVEAMAVVDTEIKMKMGDAEVAIVPGWKLTWKEHTVRPHFVAEHRSRPLRVTRKEEGT